MKFTEQLAALSLLLTTASAECTLGQSAPNGVGSTCVDCSAGTYTNTTTAVTCTACPTSTYSGAAAGSCTNCATGSTQFDESANNVNADSCSTGCSAGYGYVTATGCTICTAGEYTNNVTMTNVNVEGCNACPAGFYSDGITPSSSCLMCAAGFGTTSCSACRTGTNSVAALIADAACSMCTNDADGCWGHGTCATDTGVCTCASGWTGDFCGEFDTSVIDIATTVTAVQVDTGTVWNEDFADANSAASVALATSVSDAATATFAASAADGFILKSVDVTLSQSEDTSNRRRKRATTSVVATAALTIEHAKTVTATELTTFVNTETTASDSSFVTSGFTAQSVVITESSNSAMTGLTDGQIVGIVIGVCGSILLVIVLFLIFSKNE